MQSYYVDSDSDSDLCFSPAISNDTDSTFELNSDSSSDDSSGTESERNGEDIPDGLEEYDLGMLSVLREEANRVCPKVKVGENIEVWCRNIELYDWEEITRLVGKDAFDEDPQWTLAGFVFTALYIQQCVLTVEMPRERKKLAQDLNITANLLDLAARCFNAELGRQQKDTYVSVAAALSCSCQDGGEKLCEQRARKLETSAFGLLVDPPSDINQSFSPTVFV